MNKAKRALALAASLGLVFGGAVVAGEPGAMAAPQQASGAQMQAMNWFGGPIYNGAPALGATAALVRAGGGAQNFSFAKALVSMLGQKTVDAEVAKLGKQYGQEAVKTSSAAWTLPSRTA